MTADELFDSVKEDDISLVTPDHEITVIDSVKLKDIFEWNEKELTTLEELRDLKCNIGYYNGLRHTSFLYRGLPCYTYDLVPTLARLSENRRTIESEMKDYQELKEEGRKQGWDCFRASCDKEDLFYMSIGRHLRFPCRLLDWSASLEDALSFLAYDQEDMKGALWILASDRNICTVEDISPLTVEDNALHIIKEPYYSNGDVRFGDHPLGIRRRLMQHGFFTVTSLDNIHIPQNLLFRDFPGVNFICVYISVELSNA